MVTASGMEEAEDTPSPRCAPSKPRPRPLASSTSCPHFVGGLAPATPASAEPPQGEGDLAPAAAFLQLPRRPSGQLERRAESKASMGSFQATESSMPPGLREQLQQVLREEHAHLRDWLCRWARNQQQALEESLERAGGPPGAHSGAASQSPTYRSLFTAADLPDPGLIGVVPEPHPFHVSDVESVMVVQTPTSKTWTRGVSDESDTSHARDEWRQHLQKQVTRQLDSKDRRTWLRGCCKWTSKGRQFCKWTSKGSPMLMKWLKSNYFQAICAGVIIVNMLFIGVTSNVSMELALQEPPQEDPGWFAIGHHVFTSLYTLEVCLRLMAFRASFFVNEDWKWNIYDLFIVSTALGEVAMQEDFAGGSWFVVRGLKMLRVLRVIRLVRFFRDLRMMLCSILQSLGCLCWALLLLFMIMYIFTVFLMQALAAYLQQDPGGPGAEIVRAGSVEWYSSVAGTLYTLLAAITSGMSWVEAVRPLDEVSAFYRFLWTFYIAFVVIGVLNVLTGLFVQRACELSGLDRDLVIQAEVKRNEAFTHEMQRIFEEADEDGSGTICWEEFKGYLENDRVKAYLATQQLDAYDARTLFNILGEGKHEKEISVESFIVGCNRLRGMARSVDLVAVLHETRDVRRRLRKLSQTVAGLCGDSPRRPSGFDPAFRKSSSLNSLCSLDSLASDGGSAE